VISLSHDHKPELDHEKARIISHGGRVDKYNGKENFKIVL
jgi:hypothetical protein